MLCIFTQHVKDDKPHASDQRLPAGRYSTVSSLRKDTFMTSLICNTLERARLLGSPCLAVSTDKQKIGSKSRCSAGNAQRGPSPYPAIEAFILRHALQVSFAAYVVCLKCTIKGELDASSHRDQGGQPGHIRSWVELEDVGLVIYNIAGNRWCMNVGRAHQSNGELTALLSTSDIDCAPAEPPPCLTRSHVQVSSLWQT